VEIAGAPPDQRGGRRLRLRAALPGSDGALSAPKRRGSRRGRIAASAASSSATRSSMTLLALEAVSKSFGAGCRGAWPSMAYR